MLKEIARSLAVTAVSTLTYYGLEYGSNYLYHKYQTRQAAKAK